MVVQKALVHLAYRQVIDATSKGNFAENVFNGSYAEFLLQAQAYNPEKKFRTFDEMVAFNPKAVSLHYKVGFSVGLYIKELNNRIPEPEDTPGKRSALAAI